MSDMVTAIFDARAIPPAAAYRNTGTWNNPAQTLASLQQRGWAPSPAIVNASMDEFESELRDNHITHVGFPARVDNTIWGGMPNLDVKNLSDEFTSNSIWYGALNFPDPEFGVATLVSLGASGIIVEPYLFSPSLQLDDTSLFGIYEEIESTGVPVLVMMGGEYGENVEWGDPVRLERIAKLFPTLRIVVVHSGWPKIQSILEVAFRCPNIYLLPDVYFPGLPGETDLVLAMRTFLTDRMIYGSGFPYCPHTQQIDAIGKLDLPKDVSERFFFENGARLFNLQKSNVQQSEKK
jgi:hypothetical protein